MQRGGARADRDAVLRADGRRELLLEAGDRGPWATQPESTASAAASASRWSRYGIITGMRAGGMGVSGVGASGVRLSVVVLPLT